jgi:hypothetical protein
MQRCREVSSRQSEIDGVLAEVMSDYFSHCPAQIAITFENKGVVLKRLFLAKTLRLRFAVVEIKG